MHEKARLLPMTQPLLGLNEMVFAIKYPPALRAFPHLQRNRGNVEKLRIVHNHVAYQYNNEAVAFDWRPVGDFYFDTLPQLEAELRQALEVCAKEAALQEQPSVLPTLRISRCRADDERIRDSAAAGAT